MRLPEIAAEDCRLRRGRDGVYIGPRPIPARPRRRPDLAERSSSPKGVDGRDDRRGAERVTLRATVAVPSILAAILLSLSFHLAVAEVDRQIVTPSTQTLTDFTQSGGTFTLCAENVDDATCDYLEGDDGTGGTINPMLLPNGQGTLNDWTAVGCAEGAEWDCVNDGPSHDSDTTYVSGTQTLTAIVSEYEMQDCTGQAWCVAGQTVSNVVAWTYARFVAGVNTDPEILIEVYQGGTFCHAVSVPRVLTTSYANYSSAANTCSWTTLNLDTLRARITSSCSAMPCDEERATAVGATVTITQPNYRGSLVYDFEGVRIGGGADSGLHVRAAAASGESLRLDVFNWLTNSYENGVATFSSTSQTEIVYDLLEQTHVSTGGGVRIRLLDGTTSGDTTRSTFAVDAAFVSTDTPSDEPGGGGLGDLVGVTCERSLTEAACTAAFSPNVTGVEIQQSRWYVSRIGRSEGEFVGLGHEAGSARAHAVTFPLFVLPRDVVRVEARLYLASGQEVSAKTEFVVDNTWILVVAFFAAAVAVVVVLVGRAARRRGGRRRGRSADSPERDSPGRDWRMGLFGGGGK